MKNNLNSYLICKFCNDTFEDPIILPCYKTICSKHVYVETDGNTFKCNLCSNDHSITKNGFPKNEELASLVNVSKDYIHLDLALGENNLKAKELCNEFEEIINKSELLAKDPICYLHEYCNRIKADLDLNREKYIKSIDDQYFRMLKQIEDVEEKCKSNLSSIEISKDLNELSKEAKEKLNEFYDLSSELDIINNETWKELKYEIEKSILIAEYQLKKFEDKLLMNKSYEFEPNEQALEKLNIGELCVLERTPPDEDKKKHTVRIQVDELSELNQGEIKIMKDLHVIYNVPWIFSARIKPGEELGEINLYIKTDSVLNSKLSEIDAKLSFKVIKNDDSVSKDVTFKTFVKKIQKTSMSELFLLDLKDLTDTKFATYNNEKNCAIFELDIEIIKE